MTSTTTTSINAILKKMYPTDLVRSMVYADNPLLAMIPKDRNLVGSSVELPVVVAPGGGGSAAFSTALANVSAGTYKCFSLTTTKDYGIVQIDTEAIRASESNMGAFLRARKVEVDSKIQDVANSMSRNLYRDGKGVLGQVASTTDITTTTLKLVNPEDVRNFEIGMVLVASTASDGTGIKQSSSVDNTATVAGIDEDLGTLTLSVALDSFSSNDWATLDYVYRQGDPALVVAGLQAWLPNNAPGATSFFGVDRTAHVTKLGGVRYDGRNLPISEALVNAAARLARGGGKPDYCFLNFENFRNLENSLGSKVLYEVAKPGDAEATVGFKAITIAGPRGFIKVIPDANCPPDRAFMLQLDTWKLYSRGEAPGILNDDGNVLLRVYNADAHEIRVGFYGNLGCRAPGWNANIRLA